MDSERRILEGVKKLGLDDAEIMTSDTHYVNALSGGHNPVGNKIPDVILEQVINTTKNAMQDLEEVYCSL